MLRYPWLRKPDLPARGASVTTVLREVPLPGMPDVAPLWAVQLHTRHGVQFVAHPSAESADREAAGINDWLNAVSERENFEALVASGQITWTSAEAVEWPYSPEAHAEALARLAEEDA